MTNITDKLSELRTTLQASGSMIINGRKQTINLGQIGEEVKEAVADALTTDDIPWKTYNLGLQRSALKGSKISVSQTIDDYTDVTDHDDMLFFEIARSSVYNTDMTFTYPTNIKFCYFVTDLDGNKFTLSGIPESPNYYENFFLTTKDGNILTVQDAAEAFVGLKVSGDIEETLSIDFPVGSSTLSGNISQSPNYYDDTLIVSIKCDGELIGEVDYVGNISNITNTKDCGLDLDVSSFNFISGEYTLVFTDTPSTINTPITLTYDYISVNNEETDVCEESDFNENTYVFSKILSENVVQESIKIYLNDSQVGIVTPLGEVLGLDLDGLLTNYDESTRTLEVKINHIENFEANPDLQRPNCGHQWCSDKWGEVFPENILSIVYDTELTTEQIDTAGVFNTNNIDLTDLIGTSSYNTNNDSILLTSVEIILDETTIATTSTSGVISGTYGTSGTVSGSIDNDGLLSSLVFTEYATETCSLKIKYHFVQGEPEWRANDFDYSYISNVTHDVTNDIYKMTVIGVSENPELLKPYSLRRIDDYSMVGYIYPIVEGLEINDEWDYENDPVDEITTLGTTDFQSNFGWLDPSNNDDLIKSVDPANVSSPDNLYGKPFYPVSDATDYTNLFNDNYIYPSSGTYQWSVHSDIKFQYDRKPVNGETTANQSLMDDLSTSETIVADSTWIDPVPVDGTAGSADYYEYVLNTSDKKIYRMFHNWNGSSYDSPVVQDHDTWTCLYNFFHFYDDSVATLNGLQLYLDASFKSGTFWDVTTGEWDVFKTTLIVMQTYRDGTFGTYWDTVHATETGYETRSVNSTRTFDNATITTFQLACGIYNTAVVAYISAINPVIGTTTTSGYAKDIYDTVNVMLEANIGYMKKPLQQLYFLPDNYGAIETTQLEYNFYKVLTTSASISLDDLVGFGLPDYFSSASVEYVSCCYDHTNHYMIIAYSDVDDSNKGKIVVGDIVGSSMYFGTPVLFNDAQTSYTACCYDNVADKIVVFYTDVDDSSHGKYRVGSYSDLALDFTGASETTFNSNTTLWISACFDDGNDKVVVGFRDNDTFGKTRVGSLTGTTITFGSVDTFNSADTTKINCVYDPVETAVIITYNPKCKVGTVSGNNMSFGSENSYDLGTFTELSTTYDVTNSKMLAITDNKFGVFNISGSTITLENSVDVTSLENVTLQHVEKGNTTYLMYTLDGKAQYREVQLNIDAVIGNEPLEIVIQDANIIPPKTFTNLYRAPSIGIEIEVFDNLIQTNYVVFSDTFSSDIVSNIPFIRTNAFKPVPFNFIIETHEPQIITNLFKVPVELPIDTTIINPIVTGSAIQYVELLENNLIVPVPNYLMDYTCHVSDIDLSVDIVEISNIRSNVGSPDTQLVSIDIATPIVESKGTIVVDRVSISIVVEVIVEPHCVIPVESELDIISVVQEPDVSLDYTVSVSVEEIITSTIPTPTIIEGTKISVSGDVVELSSSIPLPLFNEGVSVSVDVVSVPVVQSAPTIVIPVAGVSSGIINWDLTTSPNANLINPSGTALFKPTGSDAWDASATSNVSFTHVDMMLEIVTDLSGGYQTFDIGFNNGNTTTAMSDLDYGVVLSGSTGFAYAYESATSSGVINSGTTRNTILRIGIHENNVSWHSDNIRSSTTASTNPTWNLLVKAIAYYDNASLTTHVNLHLDRNYVEWDTTTSPNENCTTINGSGLKRDIVGTDGWDQAGASSKVSYTRRNLILTVPEGAVPENSNSRIIGLTNGNPDNDRDSIDYAIVLGGWSGQQNNENTAFYENGTYRQTTNYGGGDAIASHEFRLEIIDNEVKYWNDTNIRYTSLITPTWPLTVKAVMYTDNKVAFDMVRIEQLPYVIWNTDLTPNANCTSSDGDIKKTGGSDGTTDGRATSTNMILFGNAELTFSIPSNSRDNNSWIGLASKLSTTIDTDDIDFGYQVDTSSYYCIENGTQHDFGIFSAGDYLTIKIDNGEIKYYKNTTLLDTLTTPIIKYPLQVVFISSEKENSDIDGCRFITNETGNISKEIIWDGNNMVDCFWDYPTHELGKSVDVNQWYDGAISAEYWESGEEYWVETELADADTTGSRSGDIALMGSPGFHGIPLMDSDYFGIYYNGSFAVIKERNRDSVHDLPTPISGDRYKIYVKNGKITYYLNGILHYVSDDICSTKVNLVARLWGYDLIVRNTIYGIWDRYPGIFPTWNGELGAPHGSTGTTTNSNSTIEVTDGDNNGFAMTVERVEREDYALEFTQDQIDGNAGHCVGINHGLPSSNNGLGMKYGFLFYINDPSSAVVLESGFNKTSVFTVTETGVFRIEVDKINDEVRYYYDGDLKYTNTSPTLVYPAYGVLIHRPSIGESYSNFKFYGRYIEEPFPLIYPSWDTTTAPLANCTGTTTASDSKVEKTSGADDDWDGGANSVESLIREDGALEFNIDGTGYYYMYCGLIDTSSTPTINANIMKFGFRTYMGDAYVFEESNLKGSVFSFTTSGVFRIEVDKINDEVRYYYDGDLKYTNTSPSFSYPYSIIMKPMELNGSASNIKLYGRYVV